MEPITVLLAEDHGIVREGLRSLLEHEADLKVVGEAQTGREAVQQTQKLRPAVVLMDIAMPLLNGLEATREIRKNCPQTKVLILSAHNDEAYIEQSVALGAAGFLLKQTSSRILAVAIREVQKGNTLFTAAIGRPLRHDGRSRRPGRGAPRKRKKSKPLTSCELAVLRLIAEGKPNKQVASKLGLSFKAVDKHRQKLMNKLNIHDIAGLTRYAIAAGIIQSFVRMKII